MGKPYRENGGAEIQVDRGKKLTKKDFDEILWIRIIREAKGAIGVKKDFDEICSKQNLIQGNFLPAFYRSILLPGSHMFP